MLNKIGTLFFLLVVAQIVFAQSNRGVGVRVKDRSGKEREVKLYDASYALIIGNSNYKYWDVLNGVKSDVSAVEKALKDNGFQVETAMDLDSRSLSPRIEQFVRDHGYEENNRLLIYYAGHGFTQKSVSDDRELGYIVPIDSPNPTKDRVGFLRTAVDLEEIRTFAKKIQSKHALFLFDSCFSGKLVSRGEIAVPPIIEESIAYPVRQFITAGAANQTVPDESIFRRAFIRGLEGEADLNKDGFILGSELASYLRDRVTNYSSRQQTPLYAKIDDINLDRGDFVFSVTNKNNQMPPESAWNNFREIAQKLLKYDNIYDFYEGLAVVELNGKYGFIDKNGNEVIQVKYERVYPFSEGLALVALQDDKRSGWKYGYINRNGYVSIPIKYDNANNFSEGLARVSFNGKVGFIDKNDKAIISFIYDYDEIDFECGDCSYRVEAESKTYSKFVEGISSVRKNGKYALIDKGGKLLTPFIYDWVGDISDGAIAVLKGDFETGKYSLINKNGKEITKQTFDYIGESSNGLREIKINEHSGFIDNTGKIKIQPKYADVSSFSEELAFVAIEEGKFGLINKNGSQLTSNKFVGLSQEFIFVNGFAEVGIPNPNFVPIKTKKSNTDKSRSEKKIRYSLLGFINKKGQEIIPLKYEKVWNYAFLDLGFAGMILNDKKGFVDIYGNEYFDF